MNKWWQKHSPFKRRGETPKVKDAGSVLKELSEYREHGLSGKAEAYKDYEEISRYYTIDNDWIFRDWTGDENWEDWMSAIHEPKLAESLDAIMSNLIPNFPRPMVQPMRTDSAPGAFAGDALLQSTLYLGGYQRALVHTCLNMALYNTGFMMPTIDRLKYFPHKRIVIGFDPPHNVLMNPNARDISEASWVIVCRQENRRRLEGLYPDMKDRLKGLAGAKPFGDKGSTGEGMTTKGYGGFGGDKKHDPDDVAIELFWRLDYTIDKVKPKEDIEKSKLENNSFFQMATGDLQEQPEDTFEIYDIHGEHIKAHEFVVEYMKNNMGDVMMNPGFALASQHLAMHYAAMKKGIEGGKFYRYPYGKRFSLIFGGMEVYADDQCPYSEFGIREFPMVDFQLLTPPGGEFWHTGLSRRVLNLNKKRDRISNSTTDIIMMHGHPIYVKMKGGPEASDRKRGGLNDVEFEDASTQGGTRFVVPPPITGEAMAATNDTDSQIERATGIYATFKGQPIGRASGRAIEALNMQGAKVIDVKLDVQKDKIARLGDMVYKMALFTSGDQEKAIVAGEHGGVHIQDVTLEDIRAMEYQVVSISGDKESLPFDQQMEGFMAMMQMIMPLFQSYPGGMAVGMEIALDFAKGVSPEFEKYEPKLRQIVEMIQMNPKLQMMMMQNGMGGGAGANAGNGSVTTATGGA